MRIMLKVHGGGVSLAKISPLGQREVCANIMCQTVLGLGSVAM